MRTNYVLIDFENVQPESLSALDAEHFKIMVFVGANQTKLSFEIANAMQRFGARGEYVKIAGNGPNALDFHIAYYIGRISAQDPSAYFHIISKDTGFDPLIKHLKDRKTPVIRSKAIEEIPMLKVSNSKEPEEKLAAIVANLRQRGASKPRALKTLSSTIGSLFQKQLPESELSSILSKLQTKGYVVVTGTKVSYALPESEA
ncbi:MAG: PIN domain-containing protein [Pseudomonadota bacterium]